MTPGLRRKMSRGGTAIYWSITAVQAAHPVKLGLFRKRERRTNAREISEAQVTGLDSD